MAITSRAARDCSLALHSSPEVVGPGSYLSTDAEPAVHGFAPFGSTMHRSVPGQAALKSANPGPGQYVINARAVGRIETAGAGAASAFISKVSRGDGSSSEAPGPGDYALKDEWQGLRTRGAPFSAPERAFAEKKGGARSRPNPPSIPASNQSFGYEEGAYGELVMQPPPPGGFSGVSGRPSVGPGSYEPQRASVVTKSVPLVHNFGNSRVQRNVFGNGSHTPGPGSYMPDANENRIAANAAFASRVPKPHQQEIEYEKVQPGPGAYLDANFSTPKPQPPHLQSFGSTQRRLASDAPTPNERNMKAQPGPGAYEAQGELARGKDPAANTSAFNSSAQRFKPMSKVREPGPGAYDELDQQSFVVAVQRKTHGRNGVFGSTTRRFHSLPKDQVPEGGSYNPQQPSAPAKEEESGSAVFASSAERFGKKDPAPGTSKAKRQTSVPAPWQYAIKTENAWGTRPGASRKSDLNFLSTVERFPHKAVAGVPFKAVPGPGAYSTPSEKLQIMSRSENFGTKEARFGTKDRGIFKVAGCPTPGPGAYEAAVEAVDPLVKRSFNITVG